MSRWLFGTKAGILVAISCICLLLGLYFAWEILYQEPAIVEILTIAKIRNRSQKQDLEELVRDWMNNSRSPEISRDARAVANQRSFIKHLISDSTGKRNIRLHSEIYQSRSLEIEFEGGRSTEKYDSDADEFEEQVISRVLERLEMSRNKLKVDDDAQSYIEIYKYGELSLSDENVTCTQLKVLPPVPVCIYPDNKDGYISADIRSTGIWEKHIVTRFKMALQEFPEAGILDLGANIGVYSLLSAGMQRRVVAVEPSLSNIKLFEKAIHIGGFESRITILRNAIANKNTVARIVDNQHNQGDVQINTTGKNDDFSHRDTQNTDISKNPYLVKTLTLNDMVGILPFHQCIVKMDIQGYEHVAFQRAKRFLESMDVPYIFMEWVLMRSFYVTDVHESDEKDMVVDMIDVLTDFGYVPYSLVSGRVLSPRSWYGWPEDVLWKKES